MSSKAPEAGIKPRAVYPAQEESDVVLKNGSTLRLRPIRSKTPRLSSRSTSGFLPDSLYFRFFSVPQLNVKKAESVCQVDYQNTFALVGEAAGRIVAVAHFFRNDKRPERAEAAFTVEDALQGQGIGTRLLERLAEIARARGIQVFEAEVLAQNRRMIGVFRNCGFELKQTFEGGVGKMVFSLTPTPGLRGALRRALGARGRRLDEAALRAEGRRGLGASRERGKIGAELFHNLVATASRERVVPSTRTPRRSCGSGATRRLRDYPAAVDLAVLVIPAARGRSRRGRLRRQGRKAIIIITAGFSETGKEGRQREAALVEKIRAAGIRMVGPNCMGLVNTDPERPPERDLRLPSTRRKGASPSPRRAERSGSRCSTTPPS